MKFFFIFWLIISGIALASEGNDVAKKYNFEKHYAYHSIPLWEKELVCFKGKADIHYLEIGVGEGQSTVWMLEQYISSRILRRG
jgi:hypothetical protein